MKNIELLSLKLNNFKGARDTEILFGKETNIMGDNATGKTTIYDSFKWLLFDKDSTDRKDFEIKTLDQNNNVIHGLEHSVTGVLSIEGTKKTLQKIYKEKWQKKRGEADSVFTGNETLYYINDRPLSQGDYKKEVAEFADEAIFKLLTDPLYFSANLKWEKRREILLAICGDVTPEEVIATNSELTPLLDLFKEEKEIKKIQQTLAGQKKRFNDDIKNIPPRIDECNKSIKDEDFESLHVDLDCAQHDLEEIDKQILSHIKTDPERVELENKLKSWNQEINNIKFKADNKAEINLNALKSSLSSKENLLRSTRSEIWTNQSRVTDLTTKDVSLDADINKCREEWAEEQGTEFIIKSNEQFKCPTCNRLLDVADIDKKKAEMQENFNLQKAKNLKRITERGNDLKKQKEANEIAIANISETIEAQTRRAEDLQKEINRAKEQIANPEPVQYGDLYYEMCSQATQLETALFDNSAIKNAEKIAEELTAKKKELQSQVDSLKSRLRQEETNKTQRARIQQLSDQERELAAKIVELEGKEFLCEKFIKAKVNMLESSINSKFQFVNFKLFAEQINGGLQEICEPLVNGVPFSDVNTAGKINAGIDIISALSEHYQICAPIWIDNRESITTLIPTNSQVINLHKTLDKQLITVIDKDYGSYRVAQ